MSLLRWLARFRSGPRTPAPEPQAESPLERARALAESGQLDAAREVLKAELLAATQPETSAEVLFALGNVEQLAGRSTEALTAYTRALERDPGHAAAWFGVAQCHLLAGKPGPANAALGRALEAQADFPAAAEALAALAIQQGDLDTAEATLRAACARTGDAVGVARPWARVLHALGRADETRAALAGILEQDPDDRASASALGQLYYAQQDWAAAERWLSRALALGPGTALERYYLAYALQMLDRYAEALRLYDELLEEDPEHKDALAQSGISLYRCGRAADAALRFERALAFAEESAVFLRALAMCWAELGRDQEALELCERVRELEPDHPEIDAVRGLALQRTGRLDEALAAYSGLLERLPEHPDGRWYRACLLLADGRWAAGWNDFRWRWNRKASAPRPQFAAPAWTGEPLAGRRILVQAEQGLGDEIMFASCIPDLVARGADCTLVCDPRLHGLFERSFPAVRVIPNDDRRPDGSGFDFALAAGDLPSVLRREAADFPRHEGYLRADPARVRRWRDRLQRLGDGPVVGISWRGGTGLTRGVVRSLRLADWLPILGLEQFTFVSLQYGPVDDELFSLFDAHGVAIQHWSEAIADYDETAALACAVDEVVSVCTSLVHLCGALGRSVQVLTPASAEWRYGRQGREMAWYPSATLIRQSEPGAWGPVVEQIAKQLQLRLPCASHK